MCQFHAGSIHCGPHNCGCGCVCVCACVLLFFVIAAPLIRFGRTMGRMTMKSTHTVLGHSLLCSYSLAPHTHLLSPHCSLCLRAPQFVQPLTRSTTHSHPSSWERGFVHELNASISCCFNPLWDAHLCVCAFRYPSSLLLP